MSHTLVKILTYDDGSKSVSNKWHWIEHQAATNRTLCEGVAFGIGDSDVKFVTKTVDKGGITCPACLSIIKQYKSIKL